DGSAIDILARGPLDAARADTFLDLSHRISDSMDMDHVATLTFAHWPGQSSDVYDDLRRITPQTAALGKFATLDEYFSTTQMADMASRFEADDYPPVHLRRAAAAGEAD